MHCHVKLVDQKRHSMFIYIYMYIDIFKKQPSAVLHTQRAIQ